jgi:hypothetical protein
MLDAENGRPDVLIVVFLLLLMAMIEGRTAGFRQWYRLLPPCLPLLFDAKSSVSSFLYDAAGCPLMDTHHHP